CGGDDRRLRGVRDDDPASRRGLDIDVVDPDAGATDDLEALGPADEFCRDLRGGADDNRVVAADDLLERAVGVDVDVEPRAEELDARVGDLLADEHFHVSNASSAAVTATPRSMSAPRSASTIS